MIPDRIARYPQFLQRGAQLLRWFARLVEFRAQLAAQLPVRGRGSFDLP